MAIRFPRPSASLVKGRWHGEAVTEGFRPQESYPKNGIPQSASLTASPIPFVPSGHFPLTRGIGLSQGGHSGKDSAMFTKNSFRRHDSAAIIRYSIRVPRKKSRYFSYYSLSFTNTHRQTALTTSPVRAVCRFVVIARERFKAIWKNSLQHGHGQSG